MDGKCPKCGPFQFDHDESKNITFIICPICKEEFGAIYKEKSPEGLEYMKRFKMLRSWEK
jgi:uncharacterized Zn finger protein (UPF0148 family)